MEQRIEVIKGDITQLEVGAVVNAANKTLVGSSGVAAAIQRAAGPELVQACSAHGGCEVGDAKITPGYQLPAKWVIHTVGPVWYGGRRGEDEALASCYRRTLELAAQYEIRTVAFPSISTGAYRFPLERAARIAVREISAVLSTNQTLEKVYLVSFDDAADECYRSLLSECAPRPLA